MNYTPLPESIGADIPLDHQEAPMTASYPGESGNKKPLYVGIIVLLAIAIGVLFFSIISRQKKTTTPSTSLRTSPPTSKTTSPSPTSVLPTESMYPTPTDYTSIIPITTPTESTQSGELTPTDAPGYVKMPTPTEDIGFPSDENPIGGSGDELSSPTATLTPIARITPELPQAGLPVPIMVIGFLGMFILLVGFVL